MTIDKTLTIATLAALFVDEMRRQGFDKQYVLPGEYDDLADALDEIDLTSEDYRGT